MSTQKTSLNCPGCHKEQIPIVNITLTSSDRYQITYYCTQKQTNQTIDINQYISSSILKTKSCDIHLNTYASYPLSKTNYACKECYISKITSNREDSQLSQKPTKRCLKHKNKRIKNYCSKCNADVCSKCITEEHIDHCDWVKLTKTDFKSKYSFRKELCLLAQNVNENLRKIDENITSLENCRKRIVQSYNNYLDVNLPVLSIYELLFNDYQLRPNNNTIKEIKAFSFDIADKTNNSKVIAKLKNEMNIIDNSVEVIRKGMDYVFQLICFTFTPIKYFNSNSISSGLMPLANNTSKAKINLTNCKTQVFNKVAITLRDHVGTIYSLIQLTNGNLASSSADGTIKIWDSSTFALIHSILAHSESVNLIKEIKENVLASCSNDNSIRLFYFDKTTTRFATIKEMAPIISIEPLSNDLLVSFFSDNIHVWNINTQLLTFSRLMTNANYITKIMKNTFAASMKDYSILIFDLFDINKNKDLIGHNDIVSSLIPFKTEYIVSGSFDCSIRVWNWNLKQCCTVFNEAHLYVINCLVELKDGRLASGSNDKVIAIWDIETKQCNVKLIGHEGAIRSLIQLANGKIVSGSSDETIKVWE